MIQLSSGQTFSGKAGTATAVTYTINKDLITTGDDFTPVQGQLASSTATLFTSTGGQTLIRSIQLTNTTASPVTGVVFYLGGTAATNQLVTLSLAANGSATYESGQGWLTYDSSGNILGGSAYVDLTTNQTVGGVKTFSSPLVLSTGEKFTGLAGSGVAYNQGLLFYDTDSESLTFMNNDSTPTLQIGQEEWVRVINKTGSTIANGSAVYISGADVTSSLPTIALAKGDAATTIIGAGLATESIANNAIGYVTTMGVVHGLDTSGFSAGATVFISATSAGALTATAPTSPNYRYRLGIVAVSSATVGSIHVTPSTAALGNGTANQLFGMNTAGTAQEVKSLTADTGNSVVVTNGTNTIKLSTPAFTGDVTKTADSNATTIKTDVALAGNPTTTTQSAGNNSTRIATTAYADAGLALKQPLDSDLTTIAGLTATTNNVMQSVGSAWASVTPTAHTATLDTVTSSLKGLMPSSQFNFISAYNGSGIIFVTSNAYSNLVCNGSTDDLAALNALYAAAPDGSTLVWPGQNATMVLSGAAAIPAGKHFIHVGGGAGNKTNILQTSLTADHFTCGDWYSTFTGFNFTTNNTSATGVQALTSGTVLNVNTISTTLVPASGSINIGSAIGWQVLTYSARTATTVTLSSTGTGNSIAGIPIVFKTAGAAVNAGNLVGIDCMSNTFSYVYNGYICAGSTSNQSRITGNGFLNTINFDVWIDGANWNGIIDSNTMDCTTNSRSVSHCEITQCGSLTGQGNQFIRGQSNLRLGSTTAAYPAGVFGVYFANCFFDNAGADAIKFQGISAIQRVKVTSSWISSATANGVNFASTASTLPSDIEFIGDNVYANTTAGFAGSGVQDYKVIGGQVAANGTGFLITANAGGTYAVTANGVRIGPTGGFGANTTGINVATGTYAAVKFDNCDTTGNTTALTLGTVTITGAIYSRYAFTNNPGINPHNAVVGPPAATPVLATTYTNVYGFRVSLAVKHGATANTSVTINGVANTMTYVAAQVATYQLEPGMTWAVAGGTAPTVWVWNGV